MTANGFDELAGSELAEITVTDTVPIDALNKPDKIRMLSVSQLLAETIQNVFSAESVSALFPGRKPAELTRVRPSGVFSGRLQPR